MARKEDCIRAAMVHGLNEEEAAALYDEIKSQQRGREAAGQVALGREIARHLMDKATAAREMNSVQRKHAALNIVKREQIRAMVDQAAAEGASFGDVMEGLMVGSHKQFTGSRQSAAKLSNAAMKDLAGIAVTGVERIEGASALLRHNPEFAKAVRREMIAPGNTGDGKAAQVAGVFSNLLEDIRTRLNDAGAFIGKLDNYAPQNHDELKLQKAGEAEWSKFIADKIDWKRSFPDVTDAGERAAMLGEIYQNIITGVSRKDPKPSSVFVRPSNMAKGLQKERVIHFKDADADMEYHERFGKGSVVGAIEAQIRKASSKLGLMEIFGPNPEAMIRNLISEEAQALRMAHKEPKDVLKLWDGHRDGKLGVYYSILSGETGSPVNLTAARIFGNSRAIIGMAKLGGALLSSFSDLVTKTYAARHNGAGWLESWHTGFRMDFERFASKEKKEMGHSLGVWTKGLLGEMYNRYDPASGPTGAISKMMDMFYKFNGLEQWTDAHTSAYTFYLSNKLGRVAKETGQDFAKVDEDFAVGLRRAGLEKYWPLLQKLSHTAEDGDIFIVPEKARDLADTDVMGLIPKRARKKTLGITDEEHAVILSREAGRVKNRMVMDIIGYFADETGYAHIEPDAKNRSLMYGNSRPGTVAGEMRRMVLQFKSFPIAYGQRILMEKRWRRASNTGFDVPGAVHFFLANTVLGYLSMSAKDLAKGKEPRSPEKFETYMAAMLQGGGLGIMGDLFLGNSDRFGNQAVASLAGPLITEVGNLLQATGMAARGDFRNAGEQTLRVGMNNLPFANLFYVRQALDYMAFFHLREAMSPGTLARSEKKMKEEFNQTYLKIGDLDFSPSTHIKKGGGWK